VSEQQEALTMTGQYLVGKKQNGTPYIWRNNSAQDIFVPAQWAAAKESVQAKGMQFLGVIHAFSNNETGELSAVANTDSPVPTAEETELMNQAMLDARYLDLFVENLQNSKVQSLKDSWYLDCKECAAGQVLNV